MNIIATLFMHSYSFGAFAPNSLKNNHLNILDTKSCLLPKQLYILPYKMSIFGAAFFWPFLQSPLHVEYVGSSTVSSTTVLQQCTSRRICGVRTVKKSSVLWCLRANRPEKKQMWSVILHFILFHVFYFMLFVMILMSVQLCSYSFIKL